jgi:hypothetical protein
MASLEENIATIRSTGIYGKDIRRAIADAIVQSDDKIANRVSTIQHQIDTRDLYMQTEKISGSKNDYLLNITNNV